MDHDDEALFVREAVLLAEVAIRLTLRELTRALEQPRHRIESVAVDVSNPRGPSVRISASSQREGGV